MSAYSEVVTQFSDGELLLEALQEMGFQPRNCIGKPEQLEGYKGDKRQQRADIIIPRRQVGGASNDIGFTRGPDGKYGAVISDYDSSRYDAEWLKKLRASYTDKGILKQAKKAGLKFVSKKRNEVTGKMDYNFLRQ